jgi:hypothetical protein
LLRSWNAEITAALITLKKEEDELGNERLLGPFCFVDESVSTALCGLLLPDRYIKHRVDAWNALEKEG